jgi:hypothetical protein
LAGGTINSSPTLNFQGGLIDARGTIDAAMMNNATLRPALGGDLAVNGNLSLLSASQFVFQLGGTTAGQFGFVNVNGQVSLGGQLALSLVNGFNPSGSDAFTLMSSSSAFAGAFTNIASGSRLQTSGGEGSFLVNYSGNTLTLSNFMSGSGPSEFSPAISVNVLNDINTQSDVGFNIENAGGTIVADATVNVSPANITANSLTAQIDNTEGSIGGNAAINMNVSGTTTVTNDATFQILGSDGAKTAAINFNGGSYNAGGTFLSYIDGNGTITFNNASAHADVLKAGVFGANGALNISGGTLSADSILKLYAPGSNGQLNFMSSVTLGGNSVILAANSITIFDTVVVTISGPMADVYTNHANYMGSGGNNSTSGTFGGAGANNPQPLINAPPFGPFSPTPITTKPRIHPRPPVTTGVINVSSSDELLALLDDFTPGRGERVRMLDSRRGNHGRHASRFNTAAYLNAARRAMDRRTAATPAMRRLPQ